MGNITYKHDYSKEIVQYNSTEEQEEAVRLGLKYMVYEYFNGYPVYAIRYDNTHPKSYVKRKPGRKVITFQELKRRSIGTIWEI